MIGGISYFHEYAYDLLAENERIIAASFDAAIARPQEGQAARRSPCSQQHGVRERHVFPTPEGHERECPPPIEHLRLPEARLRVLRPGAWEQYKLPYTIVPAVQLRRHRRERRAGRQGHPSGNIKLAMSHVVPDLVQKVVKGQDPLHILGAGEQVRCYTYGGDLAKGIVAVHVPPGRAERGLQPLDARRHHRARARRADLEEDPRRQAVPLRQRPAVPVRRASARPGRRARRSACSASRQRRRSPRCSTR